MTSARDQANGAEASRAVPWAGLPAAVVATYRTLLCLLLGAIASLVAAAVVSRYVFGAPILYSYELASVLFVWLVFLSLPGGAAAGVHLSADVIGPLLPRGAVLWLTLVGHLLSLAVLAYLIWFAWGLAGRTRVILPTLQVSMAWMYAAVPVGAALYAGWILADGWRVLRALREA